jgi:hypothetical protein
VVAEDRDFLTGLGLLVDYGLPPLGSGLVSVLLGDEALAPRLRSIAKVLPPWDDLLGATHFRHRHKL